MIAPYDQTMERPLLGRRRMLELGAGLLGAAALPSCARAAPPADLPQVELDEPVLSFRHSVRARHGLATELPRRRPAGKLPVAVFLHGTGSGHGFVFGELGAQAVLQRHVDGGGTPFAIAAVDGGDSWWHARADGTDTQSMLLAEFLPLLAGLGLDTVRIGLFGLSMGGFGVLLLASQDKVPGLRAVAAMSPAVWDRYEASREHAFDGPEDFAANDVFALRPRLAALPKRD